MENERKFSLLTFVINIVIVWRRVHIDFPSFTLHASRCRWIADDEMRIPL